MRYQIIEIFHPPFYTPEQWTRTRIKQFRTYWGAGLYWFWYFDLPADPAWRMNFTWKIEQIEEAQ